jgi:vacuole morphology and inheritance protein 14
MAVSEVSVTMSTSADTISVWIPGQGVQVDYPAIVDILLQQLDNQRGCLVL